MKQKMKYFVFNKELDFQRCQTQNMQYIDHQLKLAVHRNGDTAVLVSRVLDSQETDMEWHQMVCQLKNTGNTEFQISIYAANSLKRQIEGKIENIEGILLDPQKDVKEKKRMTQAYLQKTVRNQDDILLHDIRGRYLWFIFESKPQNGQTIEFSKFQIYFPRQSWISYLPEIYQGNDKTQFFERFLAVFQTMYEAMNREIHQVPYYMDIDCASYEYMGWLAHWIDLSESYMWTQQQLRNLLKNAVRLYKLRGTRQAVLEFVSLYINGAPVYIVENFQMRIYHRHPQEKLMERLYGADPYKFQVIVREQDVPTVREYQTLLKIIREVKPAYMETDLIVLKPYIFLDQHTYLGINSVLGEYQNMSLDGASMLSFSVLGDDKTRMN